MNFNETQSNINYLKLYLNDNRMNNLLLIVFSCISAYISYNISQNLKTVFNFMVVKNNFKAYIITISLMYLGLFILKILLNLFENFACFKGTRNLNMFCTNKLLRTDYSYFITESPNRLFSDVGSSSTNVAQFLNSIIIGMSNLIQFFVYFLIIFNINIYAGILSLAFIPIIPLSSLGMNKKLSSLQNEFFKESRVINGEAIEYLTLSKNIKAKNREKFFGDIFQKKCENSNKHMIKYSTYEAYCNNIMSLITGIVPILVLYILTAFLFKNSLKREDIIVLYLFIPLLLASFQRIYECVLKFFSTKPYIEVFKKYSSLENESKGDVKIDKFENIKIKDVRVSLSNDKIIEIPHMVINKGDRVLIKGASGIGKSTLFNILLGLRNEYEGMVEINGVNMKKLDIDSVRKIIGISFQGNGVYSMSIEDNIKLGDNGNIDDLINLLELDTLLSDKKDSVISANTISGGEKSRINIAQTIYANPEVILIDEATTNLDEDMEERILSNITKRYSKATIICISHRKSTEKYFNKIVNY